MALPFLKSGKNLQVSKKNPERNQTEIKGYPSLYGAPSTNSRLNVKKQMEQQGVKTTIW